MSKNRSGAYEGTIGAGGGSGSGTGTSNNGITGDNIKFGSKAKTAQKLSNQMKERDWTEESIKETVDNPYTTRESKNMDTGNNATVFYNRDSSHVIVDNDTKEVVQVSDRKNPSAWKPDKNIIDPYQSE